MISKIYRGLLIVLLSVCIFALVGCDFGTTKKIKVYFQWDTVANVITKEVNSGDKITPPTDISKENQEIDYWYVLGGDNTVKFNFETETITKSITLVAIWKDTIIVTDKYTVTFNSQGGTIVAPLTNVEKNSKIIEPAEPTREDFYFKGWFKEPACTNQWNFDIDVVAKDTVLYAKWEAMPTVFYDVTFYGKDNQILKKISVGKGMTITDLTAEEKAVEGYIFRRWCTDIERKNTYYVSTPVKTTLNLYALYVEEGSLSFDDYNGYYADLGLETATTGAQVKSILNTRLNDGFKNLTYGDANTALCYIDALIDDSSKVRGIYDGKSHRAVWDSGTTWNKEHVWCQSHLPVEASNSKANIASDFHNLTACTVGTNSSRNNRYYDDCTKTNCAQRLSNGTHPYGCTGTGYSYYPGDLYKGDVARILFYMETMYTQLKLTNKVYSQSSKDLEFSMLDCLLEWHVEDPVDEFEMKRNEMIYKNTVNSKYSQNNRNPFIDYPELVEMQYGDSTVAPRSRRLNASEVYKKYVVQPEYFDFEYKKEDYIG